MKKKFTLWDRMKKEDENIGEVTDLLTKEERKRVVKMPKEEYEKFYTEVVYPRAVESLRKPNGKE